MTALALALVLAAAPAGVAADTTAAPCPGAQTLDRADLDAAGISQIADLLALVDGLATATVDGFDVQPTAGLRPGRGLRVLVDGAPAASTTSVEPAGIDGLPLAVAEVLRVVVCPGPGVAGGRWGGPWLDIHTAAPARHALASVGYVNETGDPGPARYLDPTLPNVDHWGPDFEAAAVGRRGRTAVWAALRDRNLFPTDTAMAARVFDAVVPGRYPARAFTTVALALDAPGVRLRAGRARAADLPHVSELGREVPVRRRADQATAAGQISTPRAVLSGHAHAARLGLDRPSWSALAVDPAWAETRAEAGLSLTLPRPDGALVAGVQGEAVAASGPGLADGTLGVGRLFVQSERRAGRAARRLTLAAAVSGSGAALGAALAETRPAGPADVTLALSADRVLPEEAPDLAFWTARGYRGLALSAVLLGIDRAPVAADEARIRLGATGRARAGWFGTVELDASAELLRARGDLVRVRFVDAGAAVAGEATVVPARGQTFRAHAGAAARAGHLALRVAGDLDVGLGGTDAFGEAQRRRPVGRAVAEATLRPDARLSLKVRLDARTAATWTGYPRPHVPAVALVDLALVRRFWGERLRAQLVGRNVFGAPEQTHPLGATLAPRLLIRLDARF